MGTEEQDSTLYRGTVVRFNPSEKCGHLVVVTDDGNDPREVFFHINKWRRIISGATEGMLAWGAKSEKTDRVPMSGDACILHILHREDKRHPIARCWDFASA